MIRIATVEDVESIIRFMKRFEQATKYVKVDIDFAISQYEGFLRHGFGVMIIAEENGAMVGGIGGIKAPDIHNGRMMAVETYWFVDQENAGAGLALLRRFEQWAEDEGCKSVAMVHLEDSFPESLLRLYERRGYRLIERHYVKEIGQ